MTGGSRSSCRRTGPTFAASPTGWTTSSRRSAHVRLLQRAAPCPDVAPAGTVDLVAAVKARHKDVLGGLGASEGWTDTFVSAADHEGVGLAGPAVRVSNPLDGERPFLRRTLLPGLLGALAYNAGRRQPDVRLFEVGVVFSYPEEGSQRVFEHAGAGGTETPCSPGAARWSPPSSPAEGDDARARWPRGTSWPTPSVWPGSASLRPDRRVPPPGTASHALRRPGRARSGGAAHDHRQCRRGRPRRRRDLRCHPCDGWCGVGSAGGLVGGRPRIAPRRHAGPAAARRWGAVSRFPSSDIDLALVVDDGYPADAVADSLRAAAGDVLESVRLFDVYRAPGSPRVRALAYRLRFCSPERTLTDEEVGEVRPAASTPWRRSSAPSSADHGGPEGTSKPRGATPGRWHRGHEVVSVPMTRRVARVVEQELWPGLAGFSCATSVRSRHRGRYSGDTTSSPRRAGRSSGGAHGGAATRQPPQRGGHGLGPPGPPAPRRRDRHRRGMGRLASADGRRVLNAIVDVPVAARADDPSLHFARQVGFEAMLPGNVRDLAVPVEPAGWKNCAGCRPRRRSRRLSNPHLRGAVARRVPRRRVRALPPDVDRRAVRRHGQRGGGLDPRPARRSDELWRPAWGVEARRRWRAPLRPAGSWPSPSCCSLRRARARLGSSSPSSTPSTAATVSASRSNSPTSTSWPNVRRRCARIRTGNAAGERTDDRGQRHAGVRDRRCRHVLAEEPRTALRSRHQPTPDAPLSA